MNDEFLETTEDVRTEASRLIEDIEAEIGDEHPLYPKVIRLQEILAFGSLG